MVLFGTNNCNEEGIIAIKHRYEIEKEKEKLLNALKKEEREKELSGKLDTVMEKQRENGEDRP